MILYITPKSFRKKTMDAAIFNYATLAEVTPAEAWDAASLRPWALLKAAGMVRTTQSGSTVIADGSEGM